MARAPKATQASEDAQTTALTNYDEELARMAQAAAGMEASAGGGTFFSLRGGILSLNEQAIPGNQMAVVVLDHNLLNVYYGDKYDPDSPQPPTCYAIGTDEATMGPHKDVVARNQGQNETCAGCPMNAWASADTGRGKACRNTRRLAMVPAGELTRDGRFTPFTDEEHFKTAPIAGLTLPVTSVKGWANQVKTVANAMKLPPLGVMMRVSTEPDPKTQFKVKFELLGEVPKKLIPILLKRQPETKSILEQSYNLEGEAESSSKKNDGPARGRGSKAATPPKKAGGRR